MIGAGGTSWNAEAATADAPTAPGTSRASSASRPGLVRERRRRDDEDTVWTGLVRRPYMAGSSARRAPARLRKVGRPSACRKQVRTGGGFPPDFLRESQSNRASRPAHSRSTSPEVLSG